MNEHRLIKQISVTTISVWFGVLAALPFALVILISFLQHDEMHLFIFNFTWVNYQQLTNGIFFIILKNSLSLALVCTVITLIIGYPAAWLLAQVKLRYKNLLFLLMIIPFWTSSLIRTYAILTLIKAKGLINQGLLALGFIHHPLPILFTHTAVIIGLVYNLLPFMILPLYNNFEKLDHRLYEAARDLGANWFTRLGKITLPLTLPGIMVGVLFVLLPATTLFYIPDLLGGAKNLLMGNLIKNQFLAMNDWPGGCATSVILTLLLLILATAYRYINRNSSEELL